MQSSAPELSSASIRSSGDWTNQSSTMSGNSNSFNPKPVDLKNSKQDSGTEFTAPNLQKTTSWATRSKFLSPEFNNIEDEAELGKLMGDDGEKLLALVDDIRKIDSLRNEKLHIPQIVVIGDTSTGKSSVLQALTRLPFPVAGDLCTRFVTETTIRRCSPSERPGYKIEVKMDDPIVFQTAPFPPKTFESDEWVEVYQNLREDINDAFDKMSPVHLPTPVAWKYVFTGTGSLSSVRPPLLPQLLKHRLQITVRKQNQAHFSIVDIPGLVSSGAKDDIQLSVELARQYIKNEEAIVLAITPASNVIVNQKWLNLVTEEHALDRTIGVITKTDRIEEMDHEIIFNWLRNRGGSEYHLKLGWFAVRNRNSKEILDGESFEVRDKKEDEFFAGGKWKEATSRFPSSRLVDPKVLGIQHLKSTLQGHLYKRVKENFPRLRSKMRSLEAEYNAKIKSMGDPREEPRDQRIYLSEIQTRYEAEVERSLHGDYRFLEDPKHPSRLRYHIKTFNKIFEDAIHYSAVKYHWQVNGQDSALPEEGILDWIKYTWDVHRGSEPRHDPPRSLKKELVKQQTESWEEKTTAYIQLVEDAIKACNDDLFKFACKDDTLRFNIREKLQEREMKAFEDAKDELCKIHKDRDYIDSWNPLLEKIRDDSRRSRLNKQVQLPLAQPQTTSTTRADKPEQSADQMLARPQFYSDNKGFYEVYDWLFAYWKVAYPRFVDNVIIQVVERHLLGPSGPLRLFDRNWVLSLKDKDLEELVGENEETRNARKELKERLEGLREALEKAERVLRSRA